MLAREHPLPADYQPGPPPTATAPGPVQTCIQTIALRHLAADVKIILPPDQSSGQLGQECFHINDHHRADLMYSRFCLPVWSYGPATQLPGYFYFLLFPACNYLRKYSKTMTQFNRIQLHNVDIDDGIDQSNLHTIERMSFKWEELIALLGFYRSEVSFLSTVL